MDVKLSQDALEDRKSLEDENWKKVKSKIEEISSNLSHENLKLIPNPLLERPIWQLNIQETGHRVYLDALDGKMVIIAIFNFDFTHSGDMHWDEIEERM